VKSETRAGRARAALLALACSAACQSLPYDDYSAGQAALAGRDLAAALRRFDAVPVADVHYPEARLAAAAIERRLRRHKELLLLGLRLRSEWRDDDAVAAFRGALDAWPGHGETKELIAATEHRRRLVADLERRRPREPVAPAGPEPDTAPNEPTPLPSDDVPAPVATAPQVAVVAGSPDVVGAELAKLESRLAGGDLEAVLADLFAMHRRTPDDARIGSRLARLLQQRGLVRYGQGRVSDAITDWQRAIDLDASLRAAQVLLELAARELAVPR
jgi:tetratricopeptide (TPR) repeat protein